LKFIKKIFSTKKKNNILHEVYTQVLIPNKKGSKNGILFLSICSLNKNEGGISNYEKEKSITSIINDDLSIKLISSRKKAFDYIKGGFVTWQGLSSKEFEYNQELRFGKEFGGMSTRAKYLPAINRYNGRFFGALGENREKLVTESNHHLLLLTGLYGIVLPFEPLQLYSCPIMNGSVIETLWKNEQIITKVLINYCLKNSIKKIFDFTALNIYRNIIDWDMLKAGTNAEVMHCFTKLGAGDDALIRFGNVLKSRFLKESESKLLNIKPEDNISGVLFRNIAETRDDFPQEELRKIRKAESEIGKNKKYFLNEIPPDFYQKMNFEPSKNLTVSEKGATTQTYLDKGLVRKDWYLDFTNEFRKSLTQVGDRKMRGRILESISIISKDPTKISKNNKPLRAKNFTGKWSFRIGKYRIIHQPFIEEKIIAFLLVSPRSKVYDKLAN